METKKNNHAEYLTSIYFRDIRDYPLLNKEKERELIRQAQAGDLRAQSELVLCNQRFIIEVALNYQYWGLPLMDIVNEGTIGMITAIYKYNLGQRKVRFLSYAVWWVRQGIVKAVYEKVRVVSLPANISASLRKMYTLQSRGKTSKEIAKKLKITEEEVQGLLVYENNMRSIDAQVGDRGQTFVDIIPNERAEDPQVNVAKKVLQGYISKKLSGLKLRERQVIEAYFGLNENDISYNLEELGEIHGYSKERIRQIKNGAIKKLQRNCHIYELEGVA